MLLMLAACVPATVPPQLNATPGAAVVVTDGRYDAGAFSALRPDGWRVVTSAADAPPSVIFVAPDDTALIMLTTGVIGEPPRPTALTDTPLRDRLERVTLVDGQTLTVYATAPAAEWKHVRAQTDAVITSLQP